MLLRQVPTALFETSETLLLSLEKIEFVMYKQRRETVILNMLLFYHSRQQELKPSPVYIRFERWPTRLKEERRIIDPQIKNRFLLNCYSKGPIMSKH